jgi:hypothetical protein
MRAVAAAAVIALALAACNGVSQVDSGAEVTITGGFQRDDGSPAADIPVALAKELGAAEAFEGMFTVFSFGTVCLVDEPPDICRARGRLARTGDGGAYRLSLSGRDTQSFFGFASTLTVSGALPAPAGAQAGPSTTLRFAVRGAQVVLPSVRLWQAVPTLASRARRLQVDWPNSPDWMGQVERVRLLFETPTGLTVWTQDTAGAPAVVDLRLLEDFPSGVVVQAEGEATAANLTVDVSYRTVQLAVEGVGPSESRGVPCTVTDHAGTRVVSPCALTDGDLQSMLAPPMAAPGDPPPAPAPGSAAPTESVVLDLGTLAPRTLAVLRGDPTGMTVELSADGQRWGAPVHVGGEGPAVAAPLPRTDARYVRITSATGPIARLTEASIW